MTSDPKEEIRRLFRRHVPEVSAGAVEIIAVAREVGRRSYIAVRSRDAIIDPVGACTGIRGARIKPMVDELNREYLTVVRWEEAAERFIRNALAPLPISKVALEPQTHEALVTLDPATASEGTQKENSDVRLVSELTGWKITLRRVQE